MGNDFFLKVDLPLQRDKPASSYSPAFKLAQSPWSLPELCVSLLILINTLPYQESIMCQSLQQVLEAQRWLWQSVIKKSTISWGRLKHRQSAHRTLVRVTGTRGWGKPNPVGGVREGILEDAWVIRKGEKGGGKGHSRTNKQFPVASMPSAR